MHQHTEAAYQLRQALAVAHAIGMTLGGKKGEQKMKRQTRNLIKRAFPEVM